MRIWIVIFLLLSGCATSGKMNLVSIGMTKAQVIEALGPPVSTSAADGVEFMNYRLSETDDDALMGVTTPYFVRIVDGKVNAYGRHGDFGTTERPATRSKIDVTIENK